MTPGEAADALGRAVAAALEARRSALADGAESVRIALHDTLGSDAGPDGSWPALAKGTLDAKARHGQRGRVSDPDEGYASGALRESFTVDASDPDRIAVASSMPGQLARFQEGRGGVDGSPGQPPRPFVASIARSHAAPIAADVGNRVAEAIRKALREG